MIDNLKFSEFKRQYDRRIKEFQLALEASPSLEDTIKIFKDFYGYMRSLSLEIGDINEKNAPYYNLIRKDIILFEERFLNTKSISKVKANYQYIDTPELLSFKDPEFKLYSIVMQARNNFALRQNVLTDEDFNKMDFTNNCFEASFFIHTLCKRLNIESLMLKIEPGYNEDEELYNGFGYHYFVLVNIEDDCYIVDITYSQFFLWQRNILNRLGLIGITGCNPGIFMYMDPERKKVAETILKKGFIKMTKENLKCYLDGFTLSFRNINYYAETGDFSFTTPYTYEDYVKFLKGQDDQINHEGIENLGFSDNATPFVIEAVYDSTIHRDLNLK